MLKRFNREVLDIIGDILIPGANNHWPCYSYAVKNQNEMRNIFDANEISILSHLEKSLAEPDADPITEMVTFETSHPALFGKIYRFVIDGYYSAPAVAAHVVALAADAPKEIDPVFDERLLADVVARQSGKRRL